MLTLSVAEYIIELHNANSPVQYNVKVFQKWAFLNYRDMYFDGITMYKLEDLKDFLKSEFYVKTT